MKKKLFCSICLIFALILPLASCNLQGIGDDSGSEPQSDHLPIGTEGWSFSLTFGTYGISSYDSATGKLVKTTDATHPEDYVTHLTLGTEELTEIRDMLLALDVGSYPDSYDPINDPNSEEQIMTEPSRTLILSVDFAGVKKTVTCKNIAYTSSGYDEKSQAFLDACRRIQEIVTSSEEWKALPDYEFYYE